MNWHQRTQPGKSFEVERHRISSLREPHARTKTVYWTQTVVRPSAAEATAAVAEMLSDYDLGAAVNENQIDFYKQERQWKALPSVSQDKLPFPDPGLN
ncbi:hypothetical protein [Achromobacter agilis]|nr:hypothetical protein [Achromobacter agilis]